MTQVVLNSRRVRRAWPRLVPWRFRSLLARCRRDTRRGYQLLGERVAKELPVLARRLAPPPEVNRLADAMEAADHRAVVAWLVKNARPIMRHVPRARRYESFQRGIAGACVDSAGRPALEPSGANDD
jgi:hypothetical protein